MTKVVADSRHFLSLLSRPILNLLFTITTSRHSSKPHHREQSPISSPSFMITPSTLRSVAHSCEQEVLHRHHVHNNPIQTVLYCPSS